MGTTSGVEVFSAWLLTLELSGYGATTGLRLRGDRTAPAYKGGAKVGAVTDTLGGVGSRAGVGASSCPPGGVATARGARLAGIAGVTSCGVSGSGVGDPCRFAN